MQDSASRFLPVPFPAASYPAGRPRLHGSGHPSEQFVAFLLVLRIAEQRRQQRRAAGRQRAAGRPDMQGGDMPVPDVLLVDGVQGDLLQWEGGFDEAAVGHSSLRTVQKGRSSSESCALLFSLNSENRESLLSIQVHAVSLRVTVSYGSPR